MLDIFLLLYRECEGNVRSDKNMENFVKNSESFTPDLKSPLFSIVLSPET